MGAYYFLGNTLLGTSKSPPMWADGVEQESSVGMLCGTCGELWARVVSPQHPANWTFQVRACSKHGGGSFIAVWANKFDELPSEVLAYELQLRLAKEP